MTRYCKTCRTELYTTGACPFMCVWTDQEESPSWSGPYSVTYKALITNKNWIRVVKTNNAS